MYARLTRVRFRCLIELISAPFFTPAGIVGTNQNQDGQPPLSGETLILADGRRFVLDVAEAGCRGWWFRAKAQDGSCVLHGNLRLCWDPQQNAWRPGDAPVNGDAASSLPQSMRQAHQTKQKQTH